MFELDSHSAYSGTITGIRFDPFGSVTPIDIDYVYFSYVETEGGNSRLLEVEDENQWIFANASDTMRWTPQSSTAPVIENGAYVATATDADPGILP